MKLNHEEFDAAWGALERLAARTKDGQEISLLQVRELAEVLLRGSTPVDVNSMTEWQEAQAIQAQVVLKVLRAIGVPDDVLGPLAKLVLALGDVKDGIASALFEPAVQRKRTRSWESDRRVLWHGALVEAFMIGLPPEEKSRLQTAVTRVKKRLSDAGEHVTSDQLENRRRVFLEHEAMPFFRIHLQRRGFWPEAAGDVQACERLIANWTTFSREEPRELKA